MNRLIVSAALACAYAMTCGAANITESDTSWWSLEGGVLTLNNSDADISSSTNIYSATIGLDVAKIVKTGPGAVRLSGNNQYFAGEIDVQAGILMGWVKERIGGNNSNWTDDNFGKPFKVTVANDATFEMLSDPLVANAMYDNSRFGVSPATEFHIQGRGLNGMGALRRQSPASGNERSYATVASITLDGDAMVWVGMRWGYNGNSVLEMNNHSLTVAGPVGQRKIFNFCRSGETDIRNPGDIIIDGASLLFENCVPKNHSAAQVVGKYMVITNGGEYNFWVNTANMLPLYWDIKSYGGYIKGPSTSSGQSYTVKFAGGLELLSGTTYLYNSRSSGNPEIEISGTINGPGTLSTSVASSDKNVKTTLRGGGVGKTNLFARLENPYGTVVLTDADRFTITNGVTVNGPNKSGKLAATLVVTNTTLFMQPGGGKPYLAAGCTASSSPTFGVVDIRQGGVVTNDMYFGQYNKTAGALYLSGNSRLYWHCGENSNKFLGNQGCAFMGIRDEALVETLGYLNIGASGARSFVIQRGGTYRNALCSVSSDKLSSVAFKIGRSTGIGHWYQCGGTQTSQGDLLLTWGWPDEVYNARGAYTVDGSSATAEFDDVMWCITLAGTANFKSSEVGAFGTININNGGTIAVGRMYKSIATHAPSWTWETTKDVAPNSWAYLNFNGGVLKIKKTGDFFSSGGTAENARMPTRVTVYSGGAVIDTNGKDSTWRMPLEKPYGKGVASITLASSVLNNANYICPPAVRFEGDGSNVTAIVDFDETQRRNTGVIVTSPGFGFTSAPTVKVEKEVCDNASFYTDATVEMVDFDDANYAHGGITKRGAGKLTLTGVNTYGGATRLEGGTLAFANASGYPGGDLEIAASAVQSPLAAPLLTAEALALAPGKVVRVTEADTLDETTFGQMRTVATFTAPLAEVPPLVMVNSDGTGYANAGRWGLRLADGGRTLKFGPMRGVMLIVW